jgi:gluconokinase
MDVVIGIDSGTTATKGVAAAFDGELRAQASVHYPLSVPGPGRAELDSNRLREAAVEALVDVAGQCRARGDRVIAVSLSSLLHGLVPMDSGGRPLGPLVTWADGRAAAQSERLAAAGLAKKLQARTGTPVHPMAPLSKLAWWKETDPQRLRDTPRWGGVKELVLAAIADAPYLLDLSVASGTGLYDIHARRWDPEALDIAGVRVDQLATVVPTTERLRLHPEVAAAAQLPPATPLIIGAADGPLANLGVGATPAGVAAVSLGTSGALRTVVGSPTADESGRLFCYALTEDRWVIGGAVNNAGSVVRWAGQSFAAGFARPAAEGEDADERDAALLIEAASAPPGSDGLLCLPYLLGERAPWWRPGLRGAYTAAPTWYVPPSRASASSWRSSATRSPRRIWPSPRSAPPAARWRPICGSAFWPPRSTCPSPWPIRPKAPRWARACWACTPSASCPTWTTPPRSSTSASRRCPTRWTPSCTAGCGRSSSSPRWPSPMS